MAIKVSNSKKKAVFSEINITPLTDIFLVLLIIMMVVAPTFQSNNENIEIPEINSGLTVEERAATVSITKDGVFYLNGQKVEIDNLSQELTKIKPNLKKAEVLVKADTKAKSRDIMQVMRAAKEAEYEKLTVAGEPLSKKEQKQLETTTSNSTQLQTEQNTETSGINVPTDEATNARPYAGNPQHQTDWEE